MKKLTQRRNDLECAGRMENRGDKGPDHAFPMPGNGLSDMLNFLAGDALRPGEKLELDRPPSGGEHAHTVDHEGNLMSVKFRTIFQDEGSRKKTL